jgi:hypothetical protein
VERIHLSNLVLLCFYQQLLLASPLARPGLESRFMDFLTTNRFSFLFSDCSQCCRGRSRVISLLPESPIKMYKFFRFCSVYKPGGNVSVPQHHFPSRNRIRSRIKMMPLRNTCS